MSDPSPSRTPAPPPPDEERPGAPLAGDVLGDSPTGLLILDRDLRITWANEAIGRFFGIPVDQLIGRLKPEVLLERIQPVVRSPADFADRLLREYRSNAHHQAFDCFVDPGAGGEARWLHHWSHPIRTGVAAGGRVEQYVDITAQKAAEASLCESEERLRLIAENVQEAFWIYTPDFSKALYMSPAYEAIYGLPLAQLYEDGWAFLAAVHPEDRSRLQAATERAAQDAVQGVEFRILRPDGSVRWLFARGHPVRNEQGEIYRVVGIVRDVTERREAEATLQTNQRRLQQMLDALPVAVILGDAEGRIVWSNPAAERTWGSVPHVGPDGYGAFRGWWADSGARLEGQDWAAARALRGETSQGEVIDIETFDGEKRTILNYAAPLEDEAGQITGAIWVHEDITQRRQLEAQLRQAQKMEAVGRLAGGVAHDFNNLLTAITGYTQLLRTTGTLSPDQESFVGEILEAARRSGELTHQLLAFSRRQILQPKAVDLNQIVLDTVKLLRRMIGEDVQIHTTLGSRLEPVFVDPGQMEQVLMNLAVNARDAMPLGGELTIRTSALSLEEPQNYGEFQIEPGHYVVLSVSDSGEGMSEETRAQVFEPFFTTKSVGQGTGLGLATVYGIVKQSGGYITVDSEVRRGSVFSVILPMADSPAPEAPSGGAEPEELSPGTETILVVEDEASVRGLTRRILEQSGYRVLVAENGLAALERARGQRVDLLLTDVVMPRMSGRALADQLHESHPSLRVLYMSGYTADAIVRHGVLEAGVHFLQKPFTPAELSRRVREVLEDASVSFG